MRPGLERVLVVASGSAAVLALPSYLVALRQLAAQQVWTVMTHSAITLLPSGSVARFCDRVLDADQPDAGHVAVSRWPQVVVVLPATAHLLGCMANGLAPSFAASILLAVERPTVVFPVMNAQMWRRASVQRNVAQVRADGAVVVDPVLGPTFETASRSMSINPTLADPATCAQLILEHSGATQVRAAS